MKDTKFNVESIIGSTGMRKRLTKSKKNRQIGCISIGRSERMAIKILQMILLNQFNKSGRKSSK